jgi:hypothetical protein
MQWCHSWADLIWPVGPFKEKGVLQLTNALSRRGNYPYIHPHKHILLLILTFPTDKKGFLFRFLEKLTNWFHGKIIFYNGEFFPGKTETTNAVLWMGEILQKNLSLNHYIN